MTSNEVCFPRGRGQVDKSVDSTKRKKGVQKVEKPDTLFKDKSRSDHTQVTKKLKKTSSGPRVRDEDEPEMETEKMVIDRITLGKLPAEAVIIGCITKITDYEVTLTTPGNLTVSVDVFNISTAYSNAIERFLNGTSSKFSGSSPVTPQSILSVGQCLPVKILDESQDEPKSKFRRKIKGSIAPSDVHHDVLLSNVKAIVNDVVLPAAVESAEDHGYILDLGFDNKLKGFLPLEDSVSVAKRLDVKWIPVGAVFMVSGVELKGRVLTVTANEEDLLKREVTGDDELVSLHSLLPGSRVKCFIMDVKDGKGLSIVAANEVRGYIHTDYLDSEWDVVSSKGDPGTTKYKIGDTITATVLYVHSQARQVVCSLRLTSFDSQEFVNCKLMKEFQPGMLLENATVVHVEEGSCTVILKTKKGMTKLIASKNHLKDTAVIDDKVREDFPIGSKHKARVLSVSYFDRVVRVSLKPSIVNQENMVDLDSLKVGDIRTAKVVKLDEKGLTLSLGYKTPCFVRRIHLTDSVGIANFERIFPLNKEVNVRILTINRSEENSSITATCKKSLVSMKDDDVLDDFSKAVSGFVTNGVVVSSSSKGVLLEFFNNLKGYISPLLLKDYSDVEESFPLGHVAKVKVISSDESTGKINLALSSQDKPSEIIAQHLKKRPRKDSDRPEQKEPTSPMIVGSIMNARVGKFTEHGLTVTLDKPVKEGKEVTAVVPYTHLCDGPSMCKKDFIKKHPESSSVTVRIFRIRRFNDGNSIITATMKPKLMSPEVKFIPFKNMRPGVKLIGVTCATWNGGRTVEFLGGTRGFIEKKELQNLPDKLKREYKNITNGFGHLVSCKVVRIENDSKNNLFLSLLSLQELPSSASPRKRTTSASSSIFDDDSLEDEGDYHDEEDNQEEEMTREEKIDLIAELKTGLSGNRKRIRTVSNTSNLSLDGLPFQVDVNPAKITFADDEEVGNSTFIDDYNESEAENENSKNNNSSTAQKESNEFNKLSRFEKSRLKESQLRAKEAALASKDKKPESLEELERNVVSHPNSSYHWLQLMSFFIDSDEVDKSRVVGERALNTISFREESDKFNIWVALINLEHMYGTEESLKDVVKRALSAMDQKQIYRHLSSMYHGSGKEKETNETFEIMLKKFRQVSRVIFTWKLILDRKVAPCTTS